MSKRPRMTFEEHLECAKTVNEIHKNLLNLADLCGSKFGYSKPHYKYVSATIKKFDAFRSEMDNEYHAVIDTDIFYKYGHVYYGGNSNLALAQPEQEPWVKTHCGGKPNYTTPEVPCKTHPDAPHGFDRNASHSADRYVCECEGWESEEKNT